MIGVNGWCSANQASGPGSVSIGTNAELRNVSSVRIIGVLLAVSTLPADQPQRDTHSQLIANAVSASSPIAASHSTGPVGGPEPDHDGHNGDDREREHRLDHAADARARRAPIRARSPSCGSGR